LIGSNVRSKFEAVADAIAGNTKLKDLNVAWNRINGSELEYFLYCSLIATDSITSLDLSYNSLK